MPLLGGDSNSYWRFDLGLIIKGFFVILALRALTIVFEIFPTYIPIVDDAIKIIFEAMRWTATTFNAFASHYLGL